MNIGHLVENGKIALSLAPAADAGGRNGVAVSMKNYRYAYIICHLTQGNAATVAFTPEQCTLVDGTGNKAINAVPIWSNLDMATSDALVRRTDAANYTTDAALKNKIVVFQIDGDQLDVAGGFDCIRVTSGASNAANITAALIVLTGARYGQVTPPTARTD